MKLWRQTEFCDHPEAYLWFRLDRGHSGGPVSRPPVSKTLHPGRDTSHRSGAPRGRGRTRQGSSALRWSRRQSNSLRSAGRSCPPCSCRARRGWRLRLQGPSVWTRLSIAHRTPLRILEGSCRSGPSETGHHLHAEPTPAARCQGNHVLTRQQFSPSRSPPHNQVKVSFSVWAVTDEQNPNRGVNIGGQETVKSRNKL